MYAEEVEDAPGVIFGEFLVQSALASVLFDSGVLYSFISSHFMEKHDVPTIALKRPLMTRSPGGHIPCHLGVIDIPINLSGVVFLANLVLAAEASSRLLSSSATMNQSLLQDRRLAASLIQRRGLGLSVFEGSFQ